MAKSTPQMRATEPFLAPSREARGGGPTTPDTVDVVVLLAATLAKASELPGRARDARELRRRLLGVRAELTRRLARLEGAIASERAMGREFCARRAGIEAMSIREEMADTEAMLAEVDRVFRRLRREQRDAAVRLDACAAVAAGMAEGPERDRALRLVEEARAALTVPGRFGEPAGSRTAPTCSAYTFTRGDTKQTGQAR
jgi:hypothetical protein